MDLERLELLYASLKESHAPQDILDQASDLIQSAKAKTDAITSLESNLGPSLEPSVKDRVARAVRQQFKELTQKVEVGVRREVDRLVSICVDEATPALNGIDSDLDATIQSLQAKLETITQESLDILEGLEPLLAEFQEKLTLRTSHVYDLMINATVSTVTNKTREYLDHAASSLESSVTATTTTSNSELSADQDNTAVEPPKPTPPRPPPRNLPSAQNPRPISLPNPDSTTVRPVISDKPRPFSTSDDKIAETGSVSAAPTEPKIQEEVTSPSSQVKNISLMSDLNRMLAGPPPKVLRSVTKAPEEEAPSSGGHTQTTNDELSAASENHHAEAVVDAADNTAGVEDEEPVKSPLAAPDAVADISAGFSVSEEVDSLSATLVIPQGQPTKESTETDASASHAPPPVPQPSPAAQAAVAAANSNAAQSQPTPPTTPAPTTTAPASAPSPEKEKEKKKGGFMGMLSHLTKGRPKAARRSDKAEKDSSKATLEEVQWCSTRLPFTEFTNSMYPQAPATRKSTEALPHEEDEHVPPTSPTVVSDPSPPPPVVSRPHPPALPDKPTRNSAHLNSHEALESADVASTSASEHPSSHQDSSESEAAATESSEAPPRPVPRPRPAEPSPTEEGQEPSTPSEAPVVLPPRPRPAPRPVSAAISENGDKAHGEQQPHPPMPILPRPTSYPSHLEEAHEASSTIHTEPEASAESVASETPEGHPVPPPKPKKIPGVFMNHAGHNAMAAMAAAMAGRGGAPPPRPAKPPAVVATSHGETGGEEEGGGAAGSATSHHAGEVAGEGHEEPSGSQVGF
jgi:hypothetical protein